MRPRSNEELLTEVEGLAEMLEEAEKQGIRKCIEQLRSKYALNHFYAHGGDAAPHTWADWIEKELLEK